MEISVKLSNLRTSPRKVRQVIDLVRGKKAQEAQNLLSFTVNKSARPVLKLLNSAIASAKHDFQISEENLFVSKITVDEGPKLKRWHPMSRGRAYPIIKRTSHIVLVLSDGKAQTKEVKTEPAAAKSSGLLRQSSSEASVVKKVKKTVRKRTVKK